MARVLKVSVIKYIKVIASSLTKRKIPLTKVRAKYIAEEKTPAQAELLTFF
jgi:hypothetical protein